MALSCGSCPENYEYNPSAPIQCFCAIPLHVEYRLKSPGFSHFHPYYVDFEDYLTNGLVLSLYQLHISSVVWEEGPRLRMQMSLFPNNITIFNTSEVLRLRSMFTGWLIPDSDLFGPYELINFNMGYYGYGIS